MIIYVVQSGDTLLAIALRYGVTVDALVSVNRMPNPEALVPGQTIVIPLGREPFVYIVRPGDTLFALATLFSTTVPDIVAANQIVDPNLINVGQALVIPGWVAHRYTVQRGDTLYMIALRFGVTTTLLARANGIVDPNRLFIGQVILIPRRQVARPNIQVNGYYFPVSTRTATALMTQYGPYLTYISIFDYRVDEAGGITPAGDARPLIAAARAARVAPLMVLTNFRGPTFDSALARTVMSDPAIRATVIQNVLSTLRSLNYYGLNVDFENMFPEDRPLYNQFISEMASAVRGAGYLMTIAVAPKWADYPTLPWVGAFDYRTLGSLVDFMFVMTYEWGWVGGPPQAVAPVNLQRRVLEYILTLMPRERIFQGNPLYGYDWELPQTPDRPAVGVSPNDAISIAQTYGAVIQYDTTAEAPFTNYTNAAGVAHQMWFEDARSALAKNTLTRDLGLRGITYWNLTYDFPQNWAVLSEIFTPEKVI